MSFPPHSPRPSRRPGQVALSRGDAPSRPLAVRCRIFDLTIVDDSDEPRRAAGQCPTHDGAESLWQPAPGSCQQSAGDATRHVADFVRTHNMRGGNTTVGTNVVASDGVEFGVDGVRVSTHVFNTELEAGRLLAGPPYGWSAR